MKVDEKNSNICITNDSYGYSYILSNEELPMKINMNNESSESQQSFYFSIKTTKVGGGNKNLSIGIINADDDKIINDKGTSYNYYGYSLYWNKPIINNSNSNKVKS